MERALTFAPPRTVRAAIARAVLGATPAPRALGEISLLDHQQIAVDRLRVLLDERRCALLADAVGLGKTFVAAAIARDAARPLVVAPAALRSMWTSALARSDVRADWLSYESLSRSGTAGGLAPDFVILDEAHHARSATTRRYRAIAELVTSARVLFLSATPVHNHRRDVATLIALVVGSEAFAMSDAALARFVVRRERADVAASAAIPEVCPTRPIDIGDDDELLDDLLALPPPVAPADGGDAGILAAFSLAKQWASSRAALAGALRRMLARSGAIAAALESGTRPSRRDLAQWILPAGDAIQLAFAELLAPPVPETAELLRSVTAHDAAVRALSARVRADLAPDRRRADALRTVRAAHPGASIVAFSAYADTVQALYALLRQEPGVAALTARGATVAGGRLSRSEALARFAPLGLGVAAPRPIERISLLLTTDLSSEGVNLQDAEVVVHLDLPWTAARLEQRVGRSRRLGARHARTVVYAMSPPAGAERLLALERRIRAKLGAARAIVGSDLILFSDGTAASRPDGPTADRERLARRLRTWLSHDETLDAPIVSAVRAPLTGALAVVTCRGRAELVAIDPRGAVTDDVRLLLALADAAGGAECVADARQLAQVTSAVHGWLAAREGAERAGAVRALPPARRAATRAIASAVGAAPFHHRAALAEAAGRALQTASAATGIGGEWALEASLRGVDERSVVALLGTGPRHDHGDTCPALKALLLLSPGGHESA